MSVLYTDRRQIHYNFLSRICIQMYVCIYIHINIFVLKEENYGTLVKNSPRYFQGHIFNIASSTHRKTSKWKPKCVHIINNNSGGIMHILHINVIAYFKNSKYTVDKYKTSYICGFEDIAQFYLLLHISFFLCLLRRCFFIFAV